MLKKSYQHHEGYLLLESLVALSVVIFLLVSLLPLFIFMAHQRTSQREKLEATRYLMELSEMATEQLIVPADHQKESNGLVQTGNIMREQQQVVGVRVEAKGKTYAILLQQ